MELGQQLAVDEDVLELICECEDSTCTDRVEISAADFARHRGVNGVHLAAPGHLCPGRVVGRGKGYLVVADD